MIDDSGGPLSLEFDREAAFTPVGKPSKVFIREVGIYMWASIPFDKTSWDKVSPAMKAALLEHLRVNDLYNYFFICIFTSDLFIT